MDVDLVIGSLPLPIRLRPDAPMSDAELLRFSAENRAGEEAVVHENPTSVVGSGCVAGFELVMARVWG